MFIIRRRERQGQWHRENKREKDTGTESKARYREKQIEGERESQIQKERGKKTG